MKIAPAPYEINDLFDNSNPEEVLQKAVEIVRRISPAYDTGFVLTVFDDVVRLFRGEYPEYCPIGTLYHDLCHTLDVFMCAVRLMYGVHASGVRLTDDDMSVVMVAAMMHDVGYAQLEGKNCGTGAQYTVSHVYRGIEFMRKYLAEKNFPPAWAEALAPVMLCSNPALNISDIRFPDERTQLLGQIVGTADLTGQMADRTYLEKLLFLYLEFEEACFGNYRNIHDLLRNTQTFYETARVRLCEQFGGINARLSLYFKDWYGVETNYYLESIEKNLDYLSKVMLADDDSRLSMLKRGGIVSRAGKLADFVSGRPL